MQGSHAAVRIRSRAGWGMVLAAGLLALAAQPGGGAETETAPDAGAAIASADAGFAISPTRIVFENGKRNAQVTLVDRGSSSGTYRVSLVRMRMTEGGAIQEVDAAAPGERFADTLVRFSPRQIELHPNVAATIRLQLQAPADLPDGEYRSHLVIRAVPTPAAPGDAATGVSGVHIQLTPVYGVAIPVIVRRGATRAELAIRDLDLATRDGAPQQLRLALVRSGSRSVYGDLVVAYVPASGRPREVGVMRGLAVYTPNTVRRVEVPLDLGAVPLGDGRLDVTFVEPGPAHAPLAVASLPVR